MNLFFKDFSFKEKSLLISLLAVLGLYGAYFSNLLAGEVEPSFTAMLWEMIGIVVALIIVHSVYHAVISLDDQPTRDDERDRAIDRRATSISHLVLVVCVIGITALVVSEAVHYAAQLFYYRRGL